MESGELKVGTLEQIIEVDDTHSAGVKVDVPEWGLAVLVRGLTYGEVREFGEVQDGIASDAFLLKTGLVSPSITPEQATELVSKKGRVGLQRVVEKVVELSGMGTGFREEPADSDGA